MTSTPQHPPQTGSNPAQPQRKVDTLLEHYGESHQNPKNELIHFVAIPLIMLTLVGLMYAVHPWLAYAFVGASMVYYARLSVAFFLTMLLGSIAMLAAIRGLDSIGVLAPVSAGVFVVAWIFQFIGHKIEGKKPSFFEDIQYLWVGPLFVLSKLFIKLGVRW
jgi:uncharacterized membrane protein YGL010W